MSWRRGALVVLGVSITAAFVWGVSRSLPRVSEQPPLPTEDLPVTEAPPPDARHITATLYYASGDGSALIPIRREVIFADGLVPQGREILLAQLQPVTPPNVSVIPAGTTLRAFYVTPARDAFVDLSPDVSTRHSGGLAAELLSVYAIVNVITANLPTVQRVQILIDGREVDTLAGHVDLRRPLVRDLSIVRAGPDPRRPR
jgi:hypothetical protein